jgi:predicted PurR-regulated permease PerM
MPSLPPEAAAVTQSVPVHRRSQSTRVLLAGALLFVGYLFLPLWRPLLLAVVFAGAFSRHHDRLARAFGNRRYLSAGLFTFVGIVLLLAPLTTMGLVALRQAAKAVDWVNSVLRAGTVRDLVRPLPDSLERIVTPIVRRFPRSLESIPAGTGEASRWAAVQLQSVVATVSEVAFELALLIIAFFFLLTDGYRLANWMKLVSPLGRSRTQELLDEFRLVSRTLIGSNLITGVAQASVATIGYFIAGAPQPLFFGAMTLLTSFIPSVGTAIVVLPLAGLLALVGKTWGALFLAAWGLFVVAIVDNLLRPLLMKGDVHIHGAILFFALIGGIIVFGLVGVVVGPLALSFFLALMRFHARDLQQEHAASPTRGAP